MVNTTLPANIGSAARAMHTMGLSNLIVVNPKLPLDEAAVAHAAGASHILSNAIVKATLTEAISDCHWVLATSSRQRHMPQPVVTPTQAANLLWSQFSAIVTPSLIDSNHLIVPKIALVFGREDRGLTNEELQLAQYHIQIPANPTYSVLNVAAAVQVIASVLFEKAVSEQLENSLNDRSEHLTLLARQQWDALPINQAQKVLLEQQFLKLMAAYQLFNPTKPKVLPARLARLTSRLQLDEKEFELLQSLLATLQKNAP